MVCDCTRLRDGKRDPCVYMWAWGSIGLPELSLTHLELKDQGGRKDAFRAPATWPSSYSAWQHKHEPGAVSW